MMLDSSRLYAADPVAEGVSSKAARQDAVRRIPFNQMNRKAAEQIQAVVQHPTYFRRMPNQVIGCDPDMFTFLVRRPEVMVNIWDIMGITKVSAKRVTPYAFLADDGVGTLCRCELVFASQDLHIYIGDGSYDGNLTPRKVTGKCVCVLRSKRGRDASGKTQVAGTMDVFLKLDNLGADLVARSVAPFVGKTADYNFVETAKFISQISDVCVTAPTAAQKMAQQLNKLEPDVRAEFAGLVAKVGTKSLNTYPSSIRPTMRNVNPARQPAPVLHLSDREAVKSPLDRNLGMTDKDASAHESKHAASPWSELQTSLVRNDLANPDHVASRTKQARLPPSSIAPRKKNIYMRR